MVHFKRSKLFKKAIYLLLFLLIFQNMTYYVAASSTTEDVAQVELEILKVESPNSEDVDLFEEPSEDSDIIQSLSNGVEVVKLEVIQDFTKVEILTIEETEEDSVIGYIKSSLLIQRSMELEMEDDQTTNESTESDNAEPDTSNSEDEELIEADEPAMDDFHQEETLIENEDYPDSDKAVQNQSIKASKAVLANVLLEGYALKSPTNVYSEASENSKVLKTYEQGKLLKFYEFSAGWYRSSVYVNGEAITCYIKVNDVGDEAPNNTLLEGYALLNPTNVYAEPSEKSKVLKTYGQNTVLKYYYHSPGWYTSKVYVDGKAVTCYIKASDVGESKAKVEVLLSGVAVKAPTTVYAATSTGSKALKTYNQGTILKYYDYSSDWYASKVTVNGVTQVCYIKKSDVETVNTEQLSLEGIAIKSPTKVYSNPTKSSKTLKSYANGRILKYKTFTTNWYISNVIINGKSVTAYIHANDVETAVKNPEKFTGKALKSPTVVYQYASKNSSVLKSYKSGSKLIFHSYTKDWYIATVYLNGKATTGYIHTADVNDNWQEPVYSTTNYNYSLNEMINIQMSNRPRTYYNSVYVISDALYKDNNNVWRISGGPWNVRSGNNTSYGRVGQLFNTDPVTVLGSSTNSDGEIWYKISAWTVPLDTAEVGYYIDPANFKKDTPEYFQFLKLSGGAGSNVNEVNNNVLSGKGILHGKAQWFIQASTSYNINEMYLISHALLETGNGTSKLATGIKVKIKRDSNNKIVYTKDGLTDVELLNSSATNFDAVVYNMYGIGAYDGNAELGGARYAYNKGWTTPEKAIVGGADFVAENYISKGQDTIYKMRWNPDNPGTHQYATDIGWAIKQVGRIKSLYDLLNDYHLTFDVPNYK